MCWLNPPPSVISVLLLTAMSTGGAEAGQKTPAVPTSRGPVQGNFQDGAAVFLGIPFAQPPVGPMRFMSPVSPRAWTTVLPAMKFRPMCSQALPPSYVQNEDCLYLNVFSPSLNASRKYAVMFWIHGGGWMMGGASAFSPISNLVSRGVVVVTIQYRLNLVGFFSTYSSVVPGNMGLRDQIAALNWTRNEISYFGGDPEQITVFGESAGSFSTSLLTMSPLSKGSIGFFDQIKDDTHVTSDFETSSIQVFVEKGGLFSKPIMQSGSGFNPWAVDGNIIYGFSSVSRDDLAIATNCTTKAAWSANKMGPTMVSCLQSLSPAQLIKIMTQFGSMTINDFNVSYFNWLVNYAMAPHLFFGSKAPGVVSVIQNTYLPQTPPLKSNDHLGWVKTTVKAYSGFLFFAGIRKDIDTALGIGNPNVYAYSLDYISASASHPPNYTFVPHGQDLCYLFPSLNCWKFNVNDKNISNWFGQTWTLFAKTGKLTNLGMMPVTVSKPIQYYSVNIHSQMMNFYHTVSANLWNKVFPAIMGGFPTRPTTQRPVNSTTALQTTNIPTSTVVVGPGRSSTTASSGGALQQGIIHQLPNVYQETRFARKSPGEISGGRAMATEREAHRSHSPAIRNFLPGSYERSESYPGQKR